MLLLAVRSPFAVDCDKRSLMAHEFLFRTLEYSGVPLENLEFPGEWRGTRGLGFRV